MTATTFTAPGPGPVVFGLDAPAAYVRDHRQPRRRHGDGGPVLAGPRWSAPRGWPPAAPGGR